MPRFAANLSMMFTEYPFLDRFERAKTAGFDAVECWFPSEHGKHEITSRLDGLGLEMAVINTAHGSPTEWGLAALPGREAVFRASIDEALDHAAAFGNCAIHVMAGLAGDVPREAALRTYKANLEHAARRAEGTETRLLIEPLNHHDRPGYLLSSTVQAADIIDDTGLHELKIMFDCYHVEMEQGDLLGQMRRVWPKIGHIQFAGVPGRGAPTEGRVDYVGVFGEIDRLGWAGWVGAEYRPAGATDASLGWLPARPSTETAVGGPARHSAATG
jgi:hydroxypyruvate isomerase